MTDESQSQFLPWYFQREDESPDTWFYLEPRLVVHIDDFAIASIGKYLAANIAEDTVILDLLSSWRSHFPEGFRKRALVGLGLNAVEMEENAQLDKQVVKDLNDDPTLPFTDGYFDAVVITVSIQYLTNPVDVFHEVNRVLKPGSRFHVIFSNRMFPTKAVYIWRDLDDDGHQHLVNAYFEESGGWSDVETHVLGESHPFYTDPVFVVSGMKLR